MDTSRFANDTIIGGYGGETWTVLQTLERVSALMARGFDVMLTNGPYKQTVDRRHAGGSRPAFYVRRGVDTTPTYVSPEALRRSLRERAG